MKTPLLPLRALPGFRAAAEALSFKEAARQLGVSPSAISHQIAQLETYLGAAVFVRGTRAIALTPLGQKVLAIASETVGSLDRLRAASSQLARPLRVSTLPLFTQVWLLPRMKRFSALHSDIEVVITTENRVTDLDADEADVGVRNLRGKPAGLVSRKLMDIRGTPLCSPQLKGAGLPLKVPLDLAGHTLIHISARADSWAHWFQAQGLAPVKPKASITVDTVPAALEAAAQGLGIVLGMEPIVWEAEVSGRLARAIDANPVAESAYFVCTTRAKSRDPRVRAFVDWMVKEASLAVRGGTGDGTRGGLG